MSLKGDLNTIGLGEIFQMISMSAKEGTLVVKDRDSRKAIYFGREGVQLLSTGRRRGFRIGDMLVRAGKLSAEQLRQVLDQQKGTRRLLGEELVAIGLVAREDIDGVVRTQIEQEIYDLFLWKNASFEFIEGPPAEQLQDPDSHVIRLAFDPNALLLEAVRQTDEWTRVKETIPSLDCVFGFTGELHRAQELAVAEGRTRAVLQRVDGESSVNDLVDATQAPRLEVCQILVDQVRKGAVRMLDVVEVREVAQRLLAAGQPERGLRLYQCSIRLAPDDVDLTLSYAAALEREGLLPDAGRMFLRAGHLLQAQGRSREGLGYFERAVALMPDDPQTKTALFDIKLAQGNVDEALQFAEQTVQESIRTGDFQIARVVAERGVQAAPHRLEMRVGLAHAYHALGMKAQRDETVQFIHKNLPVDHAAANRILKGLREIPDLSKVAPGAEHRSRPLRRRYRRKARLMVGAALGALLVLAGIYEIQARREYARVADEVRRLEEEAEFAEARKRISSFRSGPYRVSLAALLKAYQDERALAAKSRAADEERIAQDRRAEERRQKELEAARGRVLDRMRRLEEAMEGEFSRGEMAKAQRDARALMELARQVGDERRLAAADKRDREITAYLEGAAALKEEAVRLEGAGAYEAAARKVAELLRRFPFSEAAASATYPLALRIAPDGVRILRDRELIAHSSGKDIVLRLRPDEKPFQLTFQRDGYVAKSVEIQGLLSGLVEMRLDEKRPDWTYPLGSELEAAPQVDGNLVLLQIRGRVVALDTGRRVLAWTRPVGALPGPIRAVNGVLYVASERSVLFLDPHRSMEEMEIGRFEAPNPLVVGPGFSSDRTILYACDAGRTLFAVNIATREVLWKRELSAEAVAEPSEQGGVVFVACRNGRLHAVKGPEPAPGEWTVESGGVPAGVEMFPPFLYVGIRAGRVMAVHAEGSVEWTSPSLESEILAAPVRSGRRILVPTAGGSMAALDAGRGDVLWKADTGGSLRASPVVAGGRALFGSGDGWFYALDTETGDVVWRCRTGKAVRCAATLAGTRIYFGSEDQLLYSILLD
ncbi:MAG: PQQ-binding-like beta-propeller repeat protein [Planctomycetes bacterium]|nr:PQQ-binding-like beta-propeller repeat protein [Planctomycetota bacterium]